ncbi:MAG: beta-mannanase [Chthoniobacterales bacterium]|nr:beta-mannanase [Chthoniobacterales bacterium]
MKPALFFLIFLTLAPLLPAATTPLVPSAGLLFGAYMDFGETEDHVTLEGIQAFESLVGKAPAIIASSSYWGEQNFPKSNLALIDRHGAIPMIYWSPWDKPYVQNQGPDRFSLKEILSGKWDAYIDSWADGAKDFGKPFFVSFCNEMNGDWFPWSGVYYGGENGGNEVFKQAWKYVVSRVRARGATNIRWVFHVNAFPGINEDWNLMASYYPGPDYVDWLGLSVYGKQFRSEGNWAEFRDLLAWPYEEISSLDPAKPVMLAEFGVGEFPKSGDKAKWIREALTLTPKHPRIKAAIFWHERWQNEDGTYSNLRANSSPSALEAFRKGIARPEWVGSPRGGP